MTNLKPTHRFHIPNGLAIFAALLLLGSSVVGYESNQGLNSAGQGVVPASKVDSTDADGSDDAARYTRRGLNLGLLLFRRG